MNNIIKNPAPTAIGNRVSKLVKVRNTDKQNITPHTRIRQRLVLDAVVIEMEVESFSLTSKYDDGCLCTPSNSGGAA